MTNNGTDLAIRRASASDLELIIPLFDMYRTFYGQPSAPDAARQFLGERLRRDESFIFLALVASRPAGFVQLYPTFSSVTMKRDWVLNDLFVHPDHRRRGVGRALMLAAEEFARTHSVGVPQGVKGIELVTENINAAAQSLYQSLGWFRDEKFLTYKKRF